MRFAEPLAFLFLVFVPIILGLHLLHERKLRRLISAAGDSALIAEMSSLGADGGSTARLLSTLCLCLATALVAVALARPQFGLRTEVRKGRGSDLVIALDLSRSMLARDVVPSRLERAKAELNALITELAGDRIGLVGFTSIAVPLCPLTVDHAALKLQLRDASPGDLPRGGTAIKEALTAAKQMLDGSKSAGGKAILILTDGEDNQGEAEAAAEDAKNAGIAVHLAGVGSKAGEPIPMTNERGEINGYVRDSSGQTVITHLNDSALNAIAAAGGGLLALPGQDGGLDLTAIRSHLSRLRKAELEERTVRIYEERYRWALIPAWVLMIVGTLIRPRRSRPARQLAAVLGVFVLMGNGPFEREDPDVAAGNTSLADGKNDEALKAYDRARARLKNDPRLAYDRGLAQAASGEQDAAIEDFRMSVAQAKDETLRSQAGLALGNALRQKGNYQDAITAYRNALIDNPANKAARKNLEIAQAQKRIHDLQPKQPNKDGEENKKSDQPDGGQGDGGSDGGQNSPDGGEQDGGQKPQEQDSMKDGGPEAGTSGQDSADGGTDAGPQPAPSETQDGGERLDQQKAKEILDALEQREKVLKRQRLLQRLNNAPVEKDW